jgi:hypothetical protein
MEIGFEVSLYPLEICLSLCTTEVALMLVLLRF